MRVIGPLSGCLVLLLSGCSPGGSVPDDTPFLAAIGFQTPIAASVSLNEVFNGQGQAFDSPNGHLAALFVDAGALTFVPDTTAQGGFHFNVVRGSLSNEVMVLPIATRAIKGRSDAQSWNEGPKQFYAETITYGIDLDSTIQPFIQAADQTFQLRLVLVFDPAVGRWQAIVDSQRGTTFPNNDAQQVVARLTTVSFEQLINGRDAARKVAYDQIEQQLASNGILARGQDPGVLESKNSGLAYWLYPQPFPGQSQTGAEQLCEVMHGAHYSGWRLPTPDEFRTLLRGNVFIEVPDGRLWRGVMANGTYHEFILAPDPVHYGLAVPVWQGNIRGGGMNSYNDGGNPSSALGSTFNVLCVTHI